MKRAALLYCFTATSLLAAPPKVVTTAPKAEARDVDPQLKELRVVFDQPMSQTGWSVVGGGPQFPKVIGKPKWENDRTFVWSWQLEPDHDYWLSINSQRFTNFRNAAGEPAVPHPVRFHTRKAGDPSSAPPSSVGAQNREALVHLRRAIVEDYSHHDLHLVDWAKRFAEFSSKLEASNSPRQFAEGAAELLAPARDIHLWLKVGNETIPTYRRSAVRNISRRSLPQWVPQWREHNSIISSGVFENGIRYLFIRSWPEDASQVAPALDIISDAAKAGQSLVVDVRANGGGSETTARQVAGCFVDQPIAYANHVVRANGKLSEPQTRHLQPNRNQPAFTNRVALLAGQGTVSSSEAFVSMMKQNPRCTFVGERTAGSSGNPQPIDLGNGVTAFIPSWRVMALDGTPLEGTGAKPDVEIKTAPEDFRDADPVLAGALKILHTSK